MKRVNLDHTKAESILSFSDQVYHYKEKGETLIAKYTSRCVEFLEPNKLLAYECSPVEFERLKSSKELEKTRYLMHYYSTSPDPEKSGSHYLATNDISVIQKKLDAIREPFDKLQAETKGCTIRDTETNKTIASGMRITAVQDKLKDFIRSRQEFRPGPIDLNRAMAFHGTKQDNSNELNSRKGL